MDKKIIIVVLLVVLILWFTNKSKAQAPKTENALTKASEPGATNSEEKTVIVQSGDTWYKIVFASWDFIASGLDKTKENVLAVTKLEAERNGFDWDLYDDKPTANAQDPDFLKPGQKLIVYNWASLQTPKQNYDTALNPVNLGTVSFN